MQIFYVTTEIEPGRTRIDAAIAETPKEDEVLFYAFGSDADDAKANLRLLAKDFGEAMVAEFEARTEGVRLAVRELTT